jgi:hypothetical protein
MPPLLQENNMTEYDEELPLFLRIILTGVMFATVVMVSSFILVITLVLSGVWL